MLTIGQQIYLVTGSATAHCAVATSGIHAIVTDETEKAVQLSAIGEAGRMAGAVCWLPRKAIIITKPRAQDIGTKWAMDSHMLARWFRPTGYTARWLDRQVSHSVLAA